MPFTHVMPKFQAGTLHSGGPSGPVVTNPKQAVAIMYSEKAKAKAGKSYDNGGIVKKSGPANLQKGELVVPANHPMFHQILQMFESATPSQPKDQTNPPAAAAAAPPTVGGLVNHAMKSIAGG